VYSACQPCDQEADAVFAFLQVVLSRAFADLLKVLPYALFPTRAGCLTLVQRQYGDEPTLTTSPVGRPVSQARWFVEFKDGLSEGMTKWMVAEGPWDMCVRMLWTCCVRVLMM